MNEAELAAITERKALADQKLARLVKLRDVLKQFDQEDSGERIDRVCFDLECNEAARPIVKFKRNLDCDQDAWRVAGCLQEEAGLQKEIRAALRTIIEGRIAAAAKEFEAV